MNNPYEWKRSENQFDQMRVDVGALYEQYSVDKFPSMSVQRTRLDALLRFQLIPRWRRVRIWEWAQRLNVDWQWFFEFRQYWSSILKGRPLYSPYGFYFLRNHYRLKFQSLQLPPKDESVEAHIEAWQQPEAIYYLLHSVYREGTWGGVSTEFDYLARLEHLGRQPRRLLNYGASTGLLTKVYLKLFRTASDFRIVNADIPTLAFHYGTYRFAADERVESIVLAKDNAQISLRDPVDAIFCKTVFEHLNAPMETIRRFHEYLNVGGVLIFDYILSEGTGLDTKAGLEQREDVLAFIEQHFDIVEGKIDYDRSMRLTVARKK